MATISDLAFCVTRTQHPVSDTALGPKMFVAVSKLCLDCYLSQSVLKNLKEENVTKLFSQFWRPELDYCQ